MINLFSVFEIISWSHYFHNVFTLRNSLTKNADPDKYSGHGILSDVHRTFSLLDESFDNNVIIVCVDISSSVHVDNIKKVF